MRLAALLLLPLCLLADEGMWPFNAVPKEKIKQKYGVDLTPEFLDHLRLASVRVGGASGSFVSSKGLIFTNHHVVLDCVQQVSNKTHDYVANGFYARREADELKCPGEEAVVLLKIDDITKSVGDQVKAETGSPDALKQRRAAIATSENECSTRTGNRCQAVELYGGAQTYLYEYKKYTDIRLVFAPEFNIGFFGGDPDNFTYPRYNLDIGFFRAYENGKPARTADFLKFSREGMQDKEVVFVSGNPGHTDRLLTNSEAEFYRDVRMPYSLDRLQSTIKDLEAYMAQSAENTRAAKEILFAFQNSYKAIKGEYDGLTNLQVWQVRKAAEHRLRTFISADPKLAEKYASTWADIFNSLKNAREPFIQRSVLENSNGSALLNWARQIVRLPVEKQKPTADRLKEYAGSGLSAIENSIAAPSPVTESLEKVLLENYFRALQKWLGNNNPTVTEILKGRSAADAAAFYIGGTHLADVAERKKLAASTGAVAQTQDTMIVLARILDQAGREARTTYENNIESGLNAARPKLADIHFIVNGTNEAPDATFTLRLSYGQVKAYDSASGTPAPYATELGGLFERATGTDPYKLPATWLKAKPRLDLKTPFDFVSTADIIGGNSGSPTVNAKGEIIGIVFDGNIESLPNDFQYTEIQARAVHVASQAIIETLRKIYNAAPLLSELGVDSRAKASGAPGGH